VLDVLSLETTDPSGVYLEQCLFEIEAVLLEHDVMIEKIAPVIVPTFMFKTGNLGDTFGYFLFMNGDGYSILENYKAIGAIDQDLSSQ